LVQAVQLEQIMYPTAAVEVPLHLALFQPAAEAVVERTTADLPLGQVVLVVAGLIQALALALIPALATLVDIPQLKDMRVQMVRLAAVRLVAAEAVHLRLELLEPAAELAAPGLHHQLPALL
jgi:hypothetical protein